MFHALAALLVVFLLLLFVAFCLRHAYPWSNDAIPGDPPTMFVGNVPEILKYSSPDYFVYNSVLKYGDVFRFCIPGRRTVYVCSNPELVKQFLNHPKAPSYEMFYPFLKSGLLTTNGDQWRKHRRMIDPAFSKKHLRNMYEVIVRNVLVCCELFERNSSSNEHLIPVDILQSFTFLTFDVIGETSLGIKFNAQLKPSELLQAYRVVIEELTQRDKNPLRIYNLIAKKKFDHNVEFIKGQLLRIIDQRRKSVEQNNGLKCDILSVLLQPDGDGTVIQDEEIVHHINTFLFAGHDTTSILMSVALWMLAQRPDLEQRILKELDDVLGDRVVPDYEDLSKLTYLTMFLKECLRRYPPASTARALQSGEKIGDFVLPNDSTTKYIWINTYGLHHHPKYWKDPLMFDPEHFSKEQSDARHPFCFIPFLTGARSCIGKNFALLEATLTLSVIIRKFYFRLCPGKEMVWSYVITSKPKNGLWLSVHRKKDED